MHSPHPPRNKASGTDTLAHRDPRIIVILSMRTSPSLYRGNHSIPIAGHLYARHDHPRASEAKAHSNISQDISARSPVIHAEAAPSRTSLDSRFSRINSPSMRSTSFERPERMEEETFEDVGLNDEAKPKKKGLFARFGDSSDTQQSANKSSTSFGFHIPGRKRGQSGGGSELSAVKTPTTTVAPALENSE